MVAQAYIGLSAALSFRFLVSYETLIVLLLTPSFLLLKEGFVLRISQAWCLHLDTGQDDWRIHFPAQRT